MRPDEQEIHYSFDCDNRLTGITCREGLFGLEYDDAGRRTLLTRPNGLTTRYTYDDAGRLASVVTGSLFFNHYRYDGWGNRTAMMDHEGLHAYKYDAALRLVAVTHPVYKEEFRYDACGNRTGCRRDAVNRLLEDADFLYRYDAQGRLISRQAKRTGNSTAYGWDSANRLVSVTSPGLCAEYTYDRFGRRVGKRVNGTVKRYAYDGWDIAAEYDAAGGAHAWYLHDPGTGEPLCMVKDGEVYCYHCDGLGSVVGLTDRRGRVVQRYRYSVFGSILSVLNPELGQPFAFTAKPFDSETGCYYFPYRYYAPEPGCFLSPDPLGYIDGANLYAYVRNDPVNMVDPLGLYGVDVHLHLTNRLALKVGFWKDDAWTIARANQATDEGFQSPYNPLGGTQLHFMPRDYALKGLEMAIQRPGRDLKGFGHFLHILQDTYSHEGFKWHIHVDKNGKIDIGHARAGTRPDYYVPSSLRDMAMTRETEYFLRKALDAWTPKIRAADDGKPKIFIGPAPEKSKPTTPVIRAWP